MITQLRISGALFIVLGLAHLTFGRFLNWKTDLAKLMLVNRQIFQVHCFYIALLLVLLGTLSFCCADVLLEPGPLSRAVLGGMTLLWSARLYIQWFVFDRSLWQDDQWKRAAHYVLTAFWIYVAVVDGVAFARVCTNT